MYAFGRCAALFAAWLSLGAMLAGCQTVEGGPERLYTATEEVAEARLRLPEYESAYNATRSEAERKRLRNEYITRRMYIIDVEYTQYETALTRERQQFGLASALTTQALSTAGAAFTAASTVRILSALASGVNASRGFYDSELLLSKTIQIAQGHMRAQRDRVARIILLQREKSTYDYPLSLALHDLEDYYRAGTVTSGLIEAVSAAGEQAQVAATEKAAAQGISEPGAPAATPASPRNQVGPRFPTPKVDPNHASIIDPFDSKSDSIGHVQNILRRLCATPAEVNKVTTKVNARVLAYQEYRRNFGGDTETKITGKLSRRDMDLVAGLPVCRSERFANVYEAEAFPNGINDAGLIQLINKKLPASTPQLPANASVEQVRAVIPVLRGGLNSKIQKHEGLSDQLTSDLVNAL